MGYTISKKILDLSVSSFALVFLSPLFLIIAVFIKFDKKTSRVLYQQERVGKFGKKFKIYKFQTMVDNAELILEQDAKLHA